MRTLINIVTATFILLLSLKAAAEDTIPGSNDALADRSIQRINVAYVFGGQIYNNDFVYNPGLSFEFSQGFMLSDKVSVGVGAGYMGLENENFIPIFFNVYGHQKKKGGFMRFQGGYSHAWSDQTNSIDGYDMNGGLFVDFGLGQEWKVSKKLALMLQASYRHQFATMKYQMFGGREFRDAINYDMLILSVGIINRQ